MDRIHIQPHQLRVTNPTPIQQLKDHPLPLRPAAHSATPRSALGPTSPLVVRSRCPIRKRLCGPSTSCQRPNESSTRFTSSILGTRGKCFGSLGVLTNSAGFDSTNPALAAHLNQLRIAASARATLALVNPLSSSVPMYARICPCSTADISAPAPSVSVKNSANPRTSRE